MPPEIKGESQRTRDARKGRHGSLKTGYGWVSLSMARMPVQ